MMKLFRSKWSLFFFNNNTTPLIQNRALLHTSQAPPPFDSLYLRISRSGDPSIPMSHILNQWISEGRDVTHSQLQYFVKQLRAFRRFNHALQVSEWMSNERNLHVLSGDMAVRLDLIAKVHGLDLAEKYFNSISESARDYKVYGALLNCYAQNNSVKKAEAILQKVKDLTSKHAINVVVSYNVMLKLYARVGEFNKLDSLMQEMKDKDMYDCLSLNTWLYVHVTTKDLDGMEKLLSQMEADPRATVDWMTYTTAANGYFQACEFDKAFAMLRKSEQCVKGKMRRAAYESLLTMYGSIGKRDDVYRIWDMCKSLNNSRNSSYICMLTALSKLNDIDGAEKILEEWESGNTCFDIRIPNVMISAYCKNGLLEKAEAYVERLLKGDNILDGSVWDRLARGYYTSNDMDTAVQTMKKAILASRPRSAWKPYLFTLAACIEHLKDTGDLELASEILRLCLEQGHLSTAAYDRLLSYVHGEIPETKALDLMKGYYPLKSVESFPDVVKQHEMQLQG